jgi:RNA polymerase sigma factor (sigma-70 family)
MKTMTRLVNDYLQVLISVQRRADAGDAPLLRDFVSGRDGDAFAELLRRHGPMVLGLARRVVGDRQTAEDIFQATFLVLARKAHTLRRPESLAAWLHGVAVRLALRTRKAGARRRQEEALAPAAASARDPLDELSARELLAVLDEELQRLPDNHRLPLILCGLQGLSQEEAARRLGWSAGAIKGRLERGRLHLRRLLAKRGLTLPAALAGSVLLGEWAVAVPPALAAVTRKVALTGTGISPAVLVLAEHAMRCTLASKLQSSALLLALLAVLGTGLAWWHGAFVPPGEAAAPVATEPAEQEPAKAQRDQLPDGAVLRLGTLERRAVGAELALSADGKTIIGVRGTRYVHVWDAATGRLEVRHELEQGELIDTTGAGRSLSRHGKLLVTQDYGNQLLCVYDVLSGKISRKFDMQTGGIGGGSPGDGLIGLNAVAFAPNEAMLAAVFRTGERRRLRGWDLKTGKEALDKEMPSTGAINFLTFTPDGKRLVILDRSGLAAYDAARGERLWHTRNVPTSDGYTITPDNKLLVQGDGGITAWDLATGASVPFAAPPPEAWDGPLLALPDGKTLLVGGAEGVLVWDMVKGKAIRTLAGAGETMILAPDGRSLLINNGALQRWDMATGKPLYPDTFADGHVGEVVAIKFSADGKRLASGATDGSVRLWDTASGKAVHVWRSHEARRPMPRDPWRALKAGVTALDMAHDGSQVASAGSEDRLRVWDAGTGKQLHAITLPQPTPGAWDRHVSAVRIRAGAARVVVVLGAQAHIGTIGPRPFDTRPRLVTFDLNTGAFVTSVPIGGYAAVFADRGDVLVSEGSVTDIATGQLLARMDRTATEWAEPPYAVSPDGVLVAAMLARRGKENGQEFIGSGGGAVWEARTGKRVVQFSTRSWFGGLAFHPDGRHVAVNDLDDIHLLDVTTGEVAATFHMPERIRAGTTPGSYASCMAFSPDGRRLATGHPDGTILLWEVHLPKRALRPLDVGEADKLWADLSNADAARAWRAVWRLSDFPETALPLIRKHVEPVVPAPDTVTRPLLIDLDSDDFDKRAAATAGLRKLGSRAVPPLEAHLAGNISVEAKRRIAALVQEIDKAATVGTAMALAEVRAVAALARMDSSDARAMLEALAKGVSLAPVTRAARAALGR